MSARTKYAIRLQDPDGSRYCALLDPQYQIVGWAKLNLATHLERKAACLAADRVRAFIDVQGGQQTQIDIVPVTGGSPIGYRPRSQNERMAA